jgi:lycopene cyclase domain-containing protein
MIVPAILYIAWDIYFVKKGVWYFSEYHTTGITLVNLPLEEVLFFFIVPYCCVFIYECIRTYFPNLKEKKKADMIMQVLSIALLVTGIVFYKNYYTSWTFLLNAFFIALIYAFRNYFRGFDAASFLVSYMIMLVPFLIVNGFLTAIPVVLYNDAENLGFRVYTIPFEDIFYGMLLILMTVVIYEKLMNREKLPSTQKLI